MGLIIRLYLSLYLIKNRFIFSGNVEEKFIVFFYTFFTT